MRRTLKWTIYIVYLIVILEVFSRVIIFSYLKRNLPLERFEAIFNKSNFFFCVGGLFSDRSIFEYDLYELTHLKANKEDVNADGYRGERVNIAKPPGTIRILCLGDSTSFGLGVSVEHSYPYLLQENLCRKYSYRKIEVINGAVPSTNSTEAKRRFQVKFMRYSPDIVLWRQSFNLTDSFELPQITVSDHITLWLKTKIARSCLVNLVLIPVKPGTYFDYPHKRIQVPEGVESDYDSVKLLAQEIGAEVIAIDYVVRDEVTGALRRKFEPLPDEDVVKTFPAFIESGYGPDALFYDSAHLTEIGNEILAEAIFNYLVSKQLLLKETKAVVRKE